MFQKLHQPGQGRRHHRADPLQHRHRRRPARAAGARSRWSPVSNTAPKGITDIGDYIWRVSLTEGQVIPGALKTAPGQARLQEGRRPLRQRRRLHQGGLRRHEGRPRRPQGSRSSASRPSRSRTATTTPSSPRSRPRSPTSSSSRRSSRTPPASSPRRASSAGPGPDLRRQRLQQPALIKNAGPAAEGVYVGTAWNRVSTDAANQKFLALMKTKGLDPDQFCRPGLHRRARHRRGDQARRDARAAATTSRPASPR